MVPPAGDLRRFERLKTSEDESTLKIRCNHMTHTLLRINDGHIFSSNISHLNLMLAGDNTQLGQTSNYGGIADISE